MTITRAPMFHDVLNPSHLPYRTRAQLAEEDKFSYNSLWRKAYIPNVVERMLADTAARHEAQFNTVPYQEGSTASYNPNALSGFTTNTEKPVYTHTSFKPCRNPDLAPDPISITHPIIAKRNAHRNKIDYMSTIRPDVETMNQTMRPLGTYATDVPHAQKTGTHIPQMTLGPKDMYWHPDVRLSEQSWAIATQVHESLRAPDMFKTTGQRRPASAYPSYGTHRSRGLGPNAQQQLHLERQLAASRSAAGQSQQQREQAAHDDSKGGGALRPFLKTRPMSAGPTGYGGRLPGNPTQGSNQGTPPQPLSRSSSARARPKSAVPLSPMGQRARGGEQLSSGPPAGGNAGGGISGQWGGPAGGEFTTAVAYPTAVRPSSARGQAESRQLRWAP